MTPGRQSTLITALTRGARAATASTARCTTAITSAQVSPSITVNMASVWFGRPAFNPVGQVVGQFTKVEKTATVIERWVQEYLEATARLDALNAAASV